MVSALSGCLYRLFVVTLLLGESELPDDKMIVAKKIFALQNFITSLLSA
jgi:hypothetical protein